MSAESRISSIYAKSIVSLAKEKGNLEEIKKDAETIKEACEGSRELQLLFKSPVIQSSKKLSATKAIFESNVSELMLQFLQIVCSKGRSQYVYPIAREIISTYNDINGIQEASVISAVSLSNKELQSLEALVQQYSGKSKVALAQVVDKAIIGGFVLNIEDKQVDESVQSKLRDLSVQFSK